MVLKVLRKFPPTLVTVRAEIITELILERLLYWN